MRPIEKTSPLRHTREITIGDAQGCEYVNPLSDAVPAKTSTQRAQTVNDTYCVSVAQQCETRKGS